MRKEYKTIIFDNPLAWGAGTAFSEAQEPVEGKWQVRRGVAGSSSGVLISSGIREVREVPELQFNPGLSGWHNVAVRIYHGNPHARGGYGSGNFNGTVHVGTTKDRALRLLRAELATEDFEILSLGPRDMTGASLRLDGSYNYCQIDSVHFTPCQQPMKLPQAKKELCGILDFADAPDDYRPMDVCAAECVRTHAEAGFTTLFWKAYAVRAEYHSEVAPRRTPQNQPHLRHTIGHILEQRDTLTDAVNEAHACGMKILGWMRINNEIQKNNSSDMEWSKFSDLPPFHQAHPEKRERKKDGYLEVRLSFAYREVRQYLCDIAREILEHGTDGLMVDVLRHPPMATFDKPLVDAFIEKAGHDPRLMDGDGTLEWQRFRATAFTDLLRDFRNMMDAEGYKDRPIYVRAMPQPWRLMRDGCDVNAWLEEGLVDTFVAGHHCMTSPGHPAYFDLAPIKELIAGRARLIAQVMRMSDLHTALQLGQQASEQNADGSAIYESNHVVTLPSYRDAMYKLRNL